MVAAEDQKRGWARIREITKSQFLQLVISKYFKFGQHKTTVLLWNIFMFTYFLAEFLTSSIKASFSWGFKKYDMVYLVYINVLVHLVHILVSKYLFPK